MSSILDIDNITEDRTSLIPDLLVEYFKNYDKDFFDNILDRCQGSMQEIPYTDVRNGNYIIFECDETNLITITHWEDNKQRVALSKEKQTGIVRFNNRFYVSVIDIIAGDPTRFRIFKFPTDVMNRIRMFFVGYDAGLVW